MEAAFNEMFDGFGTLKISARGNALVFRCQLDLSDFTEEEAAEFKAAIKDELDSYDDSEYDKLIEEMQQDVPSANSVIYEYCDQNGVVFASRTFTKK